ncbi:MAG TPA: hypothetical protein VHV47_07645 [Opitutaceae bacterium]|jgi:hypothetical protein|nr:hypothetical protein [Opitutaceae bacterium]
MLKWILAAVVAVAALTGFIWWQRGQTKTAYVNGLPAYDGIAGRRYIIERNCYFFEFKRNHTDFPLVADHALVPDLPEEVSARYVGADLPGVRILGILHIGEHVKIASVRRDIHRSTTDITFEIVFLTEDEHPYPRLDAFWLLDHSPESQGRPPVFLPAYTVPERSG